MTKQIDLADKIYFSAIAVYKANNKQTQPSFFSSATEVNGKVCLFY